MPLSRSQRVALMCLTQDGLAISHAEQARRLCVAGARWIQLRTKNAPPAEWLAVAKEVVAICRAHGAYCVINDSIEIALAAGADGVHLGRRDGDWRDARIRLGSERILGGTVNNVTDAQRAVQARCLDYVGVGPWRFTTTKQNLSPLLGERGVREVIARLEGIPAWVIGGVETLDLSAVRATGAAGVAVSAALFRDDKVEENVKAFAAAWNGRLETADAFSPLRTPVPDKNNGQSALLARPSTETVL